MSVIDVHITLNNWQYVPDRDPVTLSKGGGDSIKWFNDTNDKLTIEFPSGTPFPANRNPYQIPAGQTVTSGSVSAGAGTTWSYNIKSAELITDPQVIIER